MTSYGVLGEALRDIDRAFATPQRWDELIRRAREADLLGTLAHRLALRERLADVPRAPRMHLESAQVVGAAQHRAVVREVREISCVLAHLPAPTILLKGAAYLIAGLPPAEGRLFSDVDILVPKHLLPDVESSLMLAGFATTHHHPYDQRYYRRWMHELPPLQHIKRMTVLDVHHAIVPETARAHPDTPALFRAAVPVPGWSGVSVLAPTDMVLHSAVHLFHNEDFSHGLRDLVDIDLLLRHFGANPRFWGALVERATQMDLGRPLHYALRWGVRLLDTPVPDSTLRHVAADAPGAITGGMMDLLLGYALRPAFGTRSTRLARRLLYVRGHWLKMPMPLLAWHLTAKALRREAPAEA
jgi:hypothetical protein